MNLVPSPAPWMRWTNPQRKPHLTGCWPTSPWNSPAGRGAAIPARSGRALGARRGDCRPGTLRRSLLRGRLANLAGMGKRPWPTALLACPPGEEHDIPLLAFGIVLHRNGWRICYLGANTPLEDLTRTAAELQPELIVLAAVTAERFNGMDAHLSRLTRIAPLALAGAGATRSCRQSARTCSIKIQSPRPNKCPHPGNRGRRRAHRVSSPRASPCSVKAQQ